MNTLLFGAKGLAKEIINSMNQDGEFDGICLFDNVSNKHDIFLRENFEIITDENSLHKFKGSDCVIAVGGAKNREIISQKLIALGLNEAGYVSKHAKVGTLDNNIHRTVTILPDANVTISVSIGKGSLINKSVIISHDVKIGDFVELSPRVTILGRAQIGSRCEIGTGAIILPDVVIGNNCIIGAGSVVTKSISDNSLAIGVPAKVIRSNL